MTPSIRASLALLALATATCGGDGATDGEAPGFTGVWTYQEGSFSFVNCFTTSRTVDLTRSGFRIVDEAGALVRINPDGCRFTIVPTTARHARGVAGEACTVTTSDPGGGELTTVFTLTTLLLELKPDDGSEMFEVFDLAARQTSSLGTVDCQITGDNTLDRAP